MHGCPGLYLWNTGISRAELPGRQLRRPQAGLRSPADPGSAYSLFPVTAGTNRAPRHRTVPCRPHCHRALRENRGSAPWSQSSWLGTSWLRHLSSHPLPRHQFCIIGHPPSNARVQVGQPSHSSRSSSREPQGCREHGDRLDPSSNRQSDSSTALQAPEGCLLAHPP